MPLDDVESPRVPAQLFAALTAAHAQLGAGEAGFGGRVGEPVLVVAWDRPVGQRQIRVLVGGRPFFPAVGGPDLGVSGEGAWGGRALLYPPGSRAVPVPAGRVGREWAQLPFWTRCAGLPDALWVPDREPGAGKGAARAGFDDYVAHLPGGFVWLVVATPRSAGDVRRELVDLEVRIPRLRQRESSEPDRVALLRAEGRFRELSRALSSGVWQVHVLVGGESEVAARGAAALLCSASDLDDLPYVLTAGRECASLEETWGRTVGGPSPAGAGAGSAGAGPGAGGWGGAVSPFVGSSELLAAIARPPRRELPGIRVVEQPRFDVTPEHDGEIHLGQVLDDADLVVGDLGVGLDTLNRHAFVAGATGSGKSQTVRHLLEGLSGRGVPWLVIEPAKAEYAGMAGRLTGRDNGPDDNGPDGRGGGVFVIRPGDPEGVPVGLNPLEPEPGFPLQTHLDLTRALFMAAFDAQEPFPQVLSHALVTCYRELGWDLVTGDADTAGGRPKYPGLGDLQRVAMDVVEGIGYGPEISSNVRGFIDVRIGSLRLGTPGRFFEGSHPIDMGELLARNVVLEIEDIGNDSDKAFFIGAVLIRLFEHLRVRHETSSRGGAGDGPGGGGAGGLVHVTVLEEAHRLLKRAEEGSPTAHAVELFTSLLAEIRAYGEGIVVAEQIPSKIVPDVIKNTALKILHRLPAADDRESVGATMNLDEAQSRYVVTLPPGRAAVFTDGMDRPVLVGVPLGRAREDRALARGFTHTTLRDKGVSSPGEGSGSGGRLRAGTLRELNRAARIADQDPELVLWVELLVLAHVTGELAPVPRASWLESLRERFGGLRLLGFGIEYRVRASIDARYTGLAEHYRPEDLAEHLVTGITAVLDGVPGGLGGCDGSEVGWQAGPYRWIDVYVALSDEGLLPYSPHPGTPAWAARGLALTAATAAEQLAELEAHPWLWQVDYRTVTGTGEPTVWEAAIASLSNVVDPRERFVAAMKFLSPTPLGWAHNVYTDCKHRKADGQ